MTPTQISVLYIRLITKPCIARGLDLTDNLDGTVTINEKIYETINDVESLLNTVKRKDLSKKGKIY